MANALIESSCLMANALIESSHLMANALILLSIRALAIR